MAESEEELKSLLMRAEENWLETTFKKLRSWHIVPLLRGKQKEKKIEAVTGFISLGSKITETITAVTKLKDACSLEGKL